MIKTHNLVGKILIVIESYSVTLIDTTGECVKNWIDEYEKEWVKIYVGENLTKQKLYATLPIEFVGIK